MALLLAVLIAVVLIAAASALLAVQLQSRRSSTSASNRELAEAAARTGLSRIEALINNGCGDGSAVIGCRAYRYLWEIPSGTNSSNWDAAGTAAGGATIRPLLSQPCSFTPLNATDLAALKGGTVEGGRQDGGGTISSRYSVRSYSKSGPSWLLTVEGLTERSVNGAKVIVARALLSKTFETVTLGVSRQYPGNSSMEWPQLAGSVMELGESNFTTSQSAGGIQLVLDNTNTNQQAFTRADACSSTALFDWVNAFSGSQFGGIGVWPTIGQAIPGNGWFDTNVVTDQTSAGVDRVWQCDDNYEQICNNKDDFTVSVNNIILPESKICAGNTANQPCRIKIYGINLQKSRLLVEVTSRPVILWLYNDASTIKLTQDGQICPVSRGSTECLKDNPERLVIYSGSSQDGSTDDRASCANASVGTNVSIQQQSAGVVLPALVVLPYATFRVTQAARVTGVVWAYRICASSGLSVGYGMNDLDPAGVLARASALYSFPKTAAVGRYWTGVRGTLLDPLQPWQ